MLRWLWSTIKRVRLHNLHTQTTLQSLDENRLNYAQKTRIGK